MYYLEQANEEPPYFEKAYDVFVRVLYVFTAFTEEAAFAAYHAAVSQARQGNRSKALQMIEQVEKRFPESRWRLKAAELRETL